MDEIVPIKCGSFSVDYALVIHDEGKMALGIKPNGAIVIGEGFTADDAARKFWAWMETIRLDGKKVME